MYINRDDYVEKLISKKNNGLIKIITGIRRCGKSTLLKKLYINYLLKNDVDNEHIIYIALDDIKNFELLDPKVLYNYVIDQVLDEEIYYIMLDEIQNVDNFVFLLNGLLAIENIDLYVTGSNSKFLSKDIATEFRGRGDEIKVYPLSFKEYFAVCGQDKFTAWKSYMLYGGMPLILSMKDDTDKMEYLSYNKDNVYINDVIERNNIKNDKQMLELVKIISSSIGSLTNPLKIKKTFDSYGKHNVISDKTIFKYLNYLEDAFLINKSIRYDIKGKKYIDTPHKYYFTDVGIRNAFLDFRQIEESHIMENIIYNELIKRGFKVDVGLIEIRESNKRKKLEIDFIINKGYEKIYIQSVLNISDKEKEIQEKRPLVNIADAFKKIIVVASDSPSYVNEDGIIIVGIYDFLLDESYL